MPSQSLRRSVLYVPAINERAIAKLADLPCDAVIIDLEDAVAPADKSAARGKIGEIFAGRRFGGEMALRINALSSPWGREDLEAARSCQVDAVVVPKVEGPRDLVDARTLLGMGGSLGTPRLWAMIETPAVMLDLGGIAELGREGAVGLDCLIAGTNDLVKDTRVLATPDRRYLQPWLLQMVLCARAGGFSALDGVSNDFRDIAAFTRECGEARAIGFDGKTLIHPAQIGPANDAFAPSADEIAEAEAIVKAFALPENAGRGVIALGGRMVEKLHLCQAERLLEQAGQIRRRSK